jgi:hypothetical protein
MYNQPFFTPQYILQHLLAVSYDFVDLKNCFTPVSSNICSMVLFFMLYFLVLGEKIVLYLKEYNPVQQQG